MVSKEQLAEEKKKEAQFNALFEQVISKSPFGQWYPLMIGASNLLTKNLPQRVGIDEEGRPIVVYKSEVGKVLGTWAVPVHQVFAKNLSQKKWKDALSDIFTSGTVSQIKTIQRQKKAKFFDISPKEVQYFYKKKLSKEAQQKKALQTKQSKTTSNIPTEINNENFDFEKAERLKYDGDKKTNYTPLIVFSLVGIVVLIGAVSLSKKS
ncbi:MAG TPA: hypothetical protein PLD56_10395 [Chitinophagales bacterium]|nr:hypothetical protein [Chitinophagales bacterium]